MEEYSLNTLDITLFENDGRLGDTNYLSFHSLDELLLSLSYIISKKFEYIPAYRFSYEPLKISVKTKRYIESKEHDITINKRHIIYKKEGDPEDNLIVTIEEIQGLPIFIRDLNKKEARIFFYLDDWAIIDILGSGQHPILGFMHYPISKISLEYFTESDIRKLSIKNLKALDSYPVSIKIESLDEFIRTISQSIMKNLERPNYLI